MKKRCPLTNATLDDNLNVSVSVLKNRNHTMEPWMFKGQLAGIILRYRNSGGFVWQRRSGVILMPELSEPAREYVRDRFDPGHKAVREVFSALGD